MNKRIRELAEQAKDYARTQVAECKHYGYYMGQNEYELQFEKKFAKLIVRECIEQIRSQSMNSGDAWENGLHMAEYAIREHFVDEL